MKTMSRPTNIDLSPPAMTSALDRLAMEVAGNALSDIRIVGSTITAMTPEDISYVRLRVAAILTAMGDS